MLKCYEFLKYIKSKVKILFFSSILSSPSGGPYTWAMDLSNGLMEAGHDVYHLTWNTGSLRSRSQAINSNIVSQTIQLDQTFSRVPVLATMSKLFATARACQNFIEQHQIDVIHTFHIYENFSAVIASSSSVPVVLTIHGDFITEQKSFWKSAVRGGLYRPLIDFGFKRCTITVASEWLRTKLADRLKNISVRVIPNGISLHAEPTGSSARESLRLPDNKKVIVCFNNLFTLQRREGITLLAKAASLILDAVPDACFVVVGGVNNPEVDSKSIRWAQELTNGLPFIFTGFQPDSTAYLDIANVFIHPSILDNFPISILEAMQAGLPIVATRVGGIPEMIQHEQDGLLVNPTSEELANAAIRLCQNPHEAATFGQNAQKRCITEFAMGHIVNRYVDLYHSQVIRAK